MITAAKPFVLVQSEDSTEPSVSVFGRTDTTAIVIDWEDVQFDRERAAALIEQIKSHYQPGADPDDGIRSVVARLNAIVEGETDSDLDQEEIEYLETQRSQLQSFIRQRMSDHTALRARLERIARSRSQ